MHIDQFLELFIKELEVNKDLRNYYRVIDDPGRYLFRKSYIGLRLEYVYTHLGITSGKIWDVGCGYGTTSIFLALNGFEVYGNTLEYYFDKIQDRLAYWQKFGDISKLQIRYADVFELDFHPDTFDAIVAQDTLHHLEPAGQALKILNDALKPGRHLVVTEENGRSIFIGFKNFLKRGFKRVDTYYDPKLKKAILFGNENARSMHKWNLLLKKSNFAVDSDDITYLRILPPFIYQPDYYTKIPQWEQGLFRKAPLISQFLFFGLNFTASKLKQQL